MRTCKATFHVNIVEQSRREDARSVEVDPVEVIRDWLDPCERDDREQSWISWRALWLVQPRSCSVLTIFLLQALNLWKSYHEVTNIHVINKPRTWLARINQ